MSESDSFIDEVTDEVRRDRLFKTFKKYSWVLALAVVVIVGGTAYNEYAKSSAQKQAMETGDAMREAINAQDSATLANLAITNADAGVLADFQQASVLLAKDEITAAVAVLRAVTLNQNNAEIYTDLAWLKIIMIDGANLAAGERREVFDRLAAQDAPYRMLAIEQRALQHIRDGNIDAALSDFALIAADETSTQGLRNRARQMTIALGGSLDSDTTG